MSNKKKGPNSIKRKAQNKRSKKITYRITPISVNGIYNVRIYYYHGETLGDSDVEDDIEWRDTKCNVELLGNHEYRFIIINENEDDFLKKYLRESFFVQDKTCGLYRNTTFEEVYQFPIHIKVEMDA